MTRSSLAVVGASAHLQRLSAEELVTRLAAIVDSYEEAIIGRDEDGTIDTWNSAATRMFGYTPQEMIGQSVLLLVPPDMHHEELANLERLRQGLPVEKYETQRLRKGGERVDISVAVAPIKDAEGRIIGSALTAREIGAPQRENAARARLAAIVESSDNAMIAKDLNGVVTDWNGAAERMFGYTASEMIGRSILNIIPAELQREEAAILAKIRAGQRVEHYETQRLHKSGQRLEVELSLSPIRDSRGRVIGASKIARDISERRRLDAARLMLAAIVESSDDAIVSKNLDGIITSWNAAAERLFGYKADEITGQSVMRLIPRELHYEEPRIIAKLRSGERIEHFETRRQRKDGTIFDVSLTVSPIKDAAGRVIGASKIVRDISDRRAAEAALIEKEKLAATGRLAATLAHEVNNPLESITNLSYLLANHPTLDDEARGYARLLLDEVQRAGEITRQTLSYYRDSRLTGDVNIEATIEHILRSKGRKLNAKHLTLEKRFNGVPLVKGYAGELRQVFENLIENAIDAVGKDGRIVIRTRTIGAPGTEKLAVSVCDDGSGIPSHTLSKIFEPFFTTKLQTGSGLGLWVSQSVVHKHGGTIRVRSTESPGRHGSVFTVVFPVSRTAAVDQQRHKVA